MADPRDAPARRVVGIGMMRPESPRADGGMMSFREACGALGKRATRLKSADAALAASDASMKKCLTAADLLLLGVGGVIGGGVFVLTGAAAHDHAGPAVVISYVLASLTSMITGLCYTEFAVETPVAGSAYNFVSMAFGEFAGYLCGCNLALELTIAAAAVARGWTSYVATLFHASPDALRIRIGRGVHDEERGLSSSFVELDFAAAALVALVTALLAYGMKETARFNTSVTAISLLVIFFVITFGGARVEKENWTPFAPGGVEGVLAGASVVFFSFVGFDTVATCAEETRDPGRDLPIGILGSLSICAVLYALMSLVITGMVPSSEIDVQAPFAVAFRDRGMPWAESLISFGAVAAITTALLSSLMGQPRVYMAMARDGLLPMWFGTVHSRLGTPVNASAFTGVSTALLALTVDIETLAQLVSIGTLVIFAGVCAGLLVRRHTPETAIHEPHDTSLKLRQPALRRVACLTLACVAFAAFSSSLVARGVALGGAAAATVSFNSLPRHHQPTKGFATPFVPYVPALGVLATTQLIASLGALAWARFGVYTVLCSALYVWYGAAGIRGGWGPGSDGRLDAFRVMRESDDEGDAEGGMEMTPVGEDEKGGAGRGVSGGVSGGGGS